MIRKGEGRTYGMPHIVEKQLYRLCLVAPRGFPLQFRKDLPSRRSAVGAGRPSAWRRVPPANKSQPIVAVTVYPP